MKALHRNLNKYHGISLLILALVCYVLFWIIWATYGSGFEGPTTTGGYVADTFFFLAAGFAAAGIIAIVLTFFGGRSQHIVMAVFAVLFLYGAALFLHAQARQHQADTCRQAALQAPAPTDTSGFDYSGYAKLLACDQLDKRTFIL